MSGYRFIDAYATNADTEARTYMRIVTPTFITMGMTRSHTVEDPHHAATPATSDQASE